MATVKVADLQVGNVILKPYVCSESKAHWEVLLVEPLGPKLWVEVMYLGEGSPDDKDQVYGTRSTHPNRFDEWTLDPSEEVEIKDGQEAQEAQ